MKITVLRSRFFWKLYAGYVILILVAAAAIGVLVSRRIEENHRDETRRSLDGTARLLEEISRRELSRGLASAGHQALIARLGEELAVRLTVITHDGVVIADSMEDPEAMGDHSKRPEILAAGVEGVGSSVRFSRTVREKMMYVARRVESDEVLSGFVRAAVSLRSLDEGLRELRGLVAAGAAVGALIALVLGFLVGRRVLSPLVSMTRIARAIADGDFSQRVSSRGRDEISELAGSFNDMARLLEERIATVTTQRNTLEVVLGGLIEGVLAVDGDEIVVHSNRAAEEMLALSHRDSIGRPIWEITRVAAVVEAVGKTIREDSEVHEEIELMGPEEARTIELHSIPLRAEGSARAIVVLNDITETRRLETIRQEFVSNVSHELKTPVTVILGVADTMILDKEMAEVTRQRFAETIRAQALCLSAQITDILELSRLHKASDALEMVALDISRHARARVEAFRDIAEHKAIELVVELQEGLFVLGDVEAIERLVSNLLDNAIKYTPEGGTVTVRTENRSGGAVLSVADDGPGIQPEHHERIFERFYRVDPGRSRELGGTGLGLAIVKHIALAHRAELSLTSSAGAGTEFRVRFPLVDR